VHNRYLNASLQPLHLRTDVGLVLALMDMFSCLQQEMTEVCMCISITIPGVTHIVHSVAREVTVGCKICQFVTLRKGSCFGKIMAK